MPGTASTAGSKVKQLAEPVYLFTYGTLRPSLYPGVPERFNVTPVGRGQLNGHFRMFNLGRFPALVESKPNGHPEDGAQIVGEVVATNKINLVGRLDRYEGCNGDATARDGLYYRALYDVTLDSGEVLRAVWVYLQKPNPSRQIVEVTTGDWADQIPKG